jgi:excisionase family DNA binding protein
MRLNFLAETRCFTDLPLLYSSAKGTAYALETSPFVDYHSIEKIVKNLIHESAGPDRVGYWSPERAAQYVSTSKRTFADWMADGKVRFRKIGKKVLVHQAELDEDLGERADEHRKGHSRRVSLGAGNGPASRRSVTDNNAFQSARFEVTRRKCS